MSEYAWYNTVLKSRLHRLPLIKFRNCIWITQQYNTWDILVLFNIQDFQYTLCKHIGQWFKVNVKDQQNNKQKTASWKYNCFYKVWLLTSMTCVSFRNLRVLWNRKICKKIGGKKIWTGGWGFTLWWRFDQIEPYLGIGAGPLITILR